jgi:uncharacterized membrane protein
MGRDDVRFAVAAREDGLRRVRRLTFRLGAAGVVGSAAIAFALSHLPGSAAASSQSGGSSAGSGSQPGGSQPGGSQPGGTQQGGGSLQAPAQNVAPAQGPAQGVSGGS